MKLEIVKLIINFEKLKKIIRCDDKISKKVKRRKNTKISTFEFLKRLEWEGEKSGVTS